ncbi:MAG: ribose-5-phosphate isomerase RpiA [Halobacteriaceae archaeon]
MDTEAAKRRAAESAAATVPDGAVVGLGSGSTAAHAIRALGGRDVRGVPTSLQSRAVALEAGVPLVELDQVEGVDVAVDGADQVARGDAIKGGGGAHAREKVVDAAADRFLLVVDPSKEAGALDRPVPVEVLPWARPAVEAAIAGLGGEPALRAADGKSGPVVTENGNLLLDCAFGTITDPGELADSLSGLPGVVEHGLFVGMADEIHVGTEDGTRVREL